MKKTPNRDIEREIDETPAEYDFAHMTGGEQGKYYKAVQAGYSVQVEQENGAVTVYQYAPMEGVIVLDEDVRRYFPDAESVNRALRALIEIMPKTFREENQEKETTP
ncbi:MAG: hypothetical protein D6790_19325 [Caldilineae bacterium]|nr:MAG: hypothetical protein D6790_19325 [Caldilineae bacterium]